MMKVSKFYELLRGRARILLTDKKGSTVYYDGTLHSMPDAFGDWTVIDFDTKGDLAGEVTYRFQVKQ